MTLKFFIPYICLNIFLLSLPLGAEEPCPPGEFRVSGHPRKGYIRSNGSSVRPTDVTKYCKPFSKATEYLQNRFKDGLPSGWPHKKEKPEKWTEAEKRKVTQAFEILPKKLWSNSIEGIYRFKRSKDYPNPASNAEKVIVLYNTSFDSSRDLSRVLAHELSHQNFKDLKKEGRRAYRQATGWHFKVEIGRPGRPVYWVGRPDGYVEEDGRTSFEEDYANNVEHYLYSPDNLKKITPRAYDWVQKYFGEDFKIGRHQK